MGKLENARRLCSAVFWIWLRTSDSRKAYRLMSNRSTCAGCSVRPARFWNELTMSLRIALGSSPSASATNTGSGNGIRPVSGGAGPLLYIVVRVDNDLLRRDRRIRRPCRVDSHVLYFKPRETSEKVSHFP